MDGNRVPGSFSPDADGKSAGGTYIVRACRDRYDGRTRNPFNEYECGHWYARAMSSYGMMQGLTSVRMPWIKSYT